MLTRKKHAGIFAPFSIYYIFFLSNFLYDRIENTRQPVTTRHKFSRLNNNQHNFSYEVNINSQSLLIIVDLQAITECVLKKEINKI